MANPSKKNSPQYAREFEQIAKKISLKRIAIGVLIALLALNLMARMIRAHRRAEVAAMMGQSGTVGQPGATFETPRDSRLTWEFKSDTLAFSSIALAPDGTIFAGAHNAIFALAPDGSLKWKKTLAGFQLIATDGSGGMYTASSVGFVVGLSGNDGAITWDPKMGLIGFAAPPTIGVCEFGWRHIRVPAAKLEYGDLVAFDVPRGDALQRLRAARKRASGPDRNEGGSSNL